MTLKVEFSAENRQQADTILNDLLAKRLVTGGQFIETPARFLWKGEVTDMDYCTVTSFTLPKHKESIIRAITAMSEEEVPMIAFYPLEGNEALEEWVGKTCP